jgi:hypothetical protein
MFFTHQRLNVKHAIKHISQYTLPESYFNNWLGGVTDGDGSFSFSVNKKESCIWDCTFKIAQSTYNLRLLYYIKKNLGYGSVNTKSGKNMAEFRIRDRKTLLYLIVPLFTQYPLYSTKQFYFSRWVKALHILENTTYTQNEKNTLLTQLKSEVPTDTYISPAWGSIEPHFNYGSIEPCLKWENTPSADWVYGFIEAEASFFIVNKDKKVTRMAHSFGITQKLDKIILDFLQKKFHISSKVMHTKRDIYRLETTNSRSIEKIRKFFLNKLKGMKSVEYRIWARSLNYTKNTKFVLKSNEKFLKVQNQLQKLRNKRKV